MDQMKKKTFDDFRRNKNETTFHQLFVEIAEEAACTEPYLEHENTSAAHIGKSCG